jgi:hypothetical protein
MRLSSVCGLHGDDKEQRLSGQPPYFLWAVWAIAKKSRITSRQMLSMVIFLRVFIISVVLMVWRRLHDNSTCLLARGLQYSYYIAWRTFNMNLLIRIWETYAFSTNLKHHIEFDYSDKNERIKNVRVSSNYYANPIADTFENPISLGEGRQRVVVSSSTTGNLASVTQWRHVALISTQIVFYSSLKVQH